jgi:NAD-dependent dihydropyrimidine dehydrogenase PreA subunit
MLMVCVIIELCMHDGTCAEMRPVVSIVPGPADKGWPTYHIDPDPCIDCGGYAPACPVESIYAQYTRKSAPSTI